MKKLLIGLFVFVILLALVVVGVGFVLPKEYEVTREIEIDAKPEVVYSHLVDLEEWPKWSYWTEEHIDGLEVTLGEKTVGEGASQSWTDASGTKGQLDIIATTTNEKIATEMRYGDSPPMTSVMSLSSVEQDGEKTKLTWYSKGSCGDGFVAGWFCLLMPSMIGKDYDYGLQHLKELAEETASATSDKATDESETDEESSEEDTTESASPDSEGKSDVEAVETDQKGDDSSESN